jgi:hypothetical protein
MSDARGVQPGPASEAAALAGLTVHVAPGANLAGVGRFYEQVARLLRVISKGPRACCDCMLVLRFWLCDVGR